MTAAYITCAWTNRYGGRCTGEALDPEVRICSRHAAEVMALIRNRIAAARRAKTGTTRTEGEAAHAT